MVVLLASQSASRSEVPAEPVSVPVPSRLAAEEARAESERTSRSAFTGASAEPVTLPAPRSLPSPPTHASSSV